MTWKTLMVHLNLVHANTEVLRVTADLARRFDARVIGVSGSEPSPVIFTDGYQPSAFVVESNAAIKEQQHVVKAEFEAAFPSSARVEWRTPRLSSSIAGYIAHESRSADLVITSGLAPERQDFAPTEIAAAIVLQTGRPVLVVPRTPLRPSIDHAVVAWRNTREARRAVADALPLLALTSHVTVIEVADERERGRVIAELAEIVGWLKTHAIEAKPQFLPSNDDDDATHLHEEAVRLGADVVVAGAYGHSRLREWAFGGMTRSLVSQSSICALLSH